MNYPAGFCPLPWVHQATTTAGSLMLCCVAKEDSNLNLNRDSLRESFHSEYWNEIRRQILNGEKPKPCARCWTEEANGGLSHRLTEIEVWQRKLGPSRLRELVYSTLPDGSIDTDPVSLDLRIGNTCNLQCVICRPHESSKWLELSRKLALEATHPTLKGDLEHKNSMQIENYAWQNNNAIWEELRAAAPNLQELIIGGGEPMLLKGHFEFLKFCVDNGFAKNIHLRYHTNLTVLNPAKFDLWKHFKIVELFASIDGLGDKNHYVRYPADWSAVECNLNLLDEVKLPNIRSMILFSAHFINLFDLVELQDWILRRQFKRVTRGFHGLLHHSAVMHPELLSAQVLPAEIKREISERLLKFERGNPRPSKKIGGVIGYMNAKDESHLLPATIEYIRLLDRVRGTNFQATFSELFQRLEPYWNLSTDAATPLSSRSIPQPANSIDSGV